MVLKKSWVGSLTPTSLLLYTPLMAANALIDYEVACTFSPSLFYNCGGGTEKYD